jgi:hypothetical protein
MRWAGHVARRRGQCVRVWCESPKERDHSEDRSVDGRRGSEWILGRLAEEVWCGLNWLRLWTGGGLL